MIEARLMLPVNPILERRIVMPPPIILPPSDSNEALVEGIAQAMTNDTTLLLEPGVHYTRAGVLQRIAVGANGLRIGSTGPSPLPIKSKVEKACVRRPCHSISQTKPDSNFGLFFIPTRPSEEELAQATWKQFTGADGSSFEFDIIMRGRIEIGRLLVDCNMQNQGLDTMPKDAAQHSAMLGFSGYRYSVPSTGLPRFVYVGFESVALTDMGFINGGFADDVWITYTRGAFYPHIGQVSIDHVASAQRINPRRATLSFSGLAQRVIIHDTDVYNLHGEIDSNWRKAPRPGARFSNSVWDLDHINSELMTFSIKGKVLSLNASHLNVTKGFLVGYAGGAIADSRLRIGSEGRFFRLDGLDFDRVTWQLAADANGVVRGISPTCRFDDSCVANFRHNTFTVLGSFSTGQLINSEYSTKELQNNVTLEFSGCSYESAFGTPTRPHTSIARVKERGTWKFRRADLGGRDPDQALPKGNQPDVTLVLV
jgi:hypothetical protein